MDWAVTTVLFIICAWLSTAPMRHPPEEARLDSAALTYVSANGFDEVVSIVQGRCSMCHAREPGWEGIHMAPKGVVLETPSDIAREAAQIYMQAGITHAMPPANLSYMEPQERAANRGMVPGRGDDAGCLGLTGLPIHLGGKYSGGPGAGPRPCYIPMSCRRIAASDADRLRRA